MILFIVGLFIGCIAGVLIIGLVGNGARSEIETEIMRKNKRIEDQVKMIFEMRAELVKQKGIAASEETRADLLQMMKDKLQKEYDELKEYYDELAKDYKEFVLDYKKLYIELDAIKASEVRKFRTPEEIESLLKLDIDFNELISDLSTIEEMLLEAKEQKVKLAV